MKKIIPYLAVELLFLIGMFAGGNENIMALCFIMLIAFPIIVLLFKFFKNIEKTPSREKPIEPAEPAETRKLTYDEYLWLQDTEDIGNRFYRAYKDDLEENDDYHMTKKEILEDYYDGDKIYKYEPFLLPFKVEDGKVYSYIKEDDWVCVGTLKKRDIAKYERSRKSELYLMPNYFKKVYDDEVEADHGDTYFGLLVVLEQ